MRIDYLKKIITLHIVFLFLNGCIESTALLGPAITAGTSGNIYQASLSYGTNKILIETTGKSPIEHVAELMDSKNENQGDLSSILNSKLKSFDDKVKKAELKTKNEQEDFFATVKKIHSKQRLKVNNFDQFILY